MINVKKPNRWSYIAVLTPFVGILIFNAQYYYPFLSDDALISLRYVERFLGGHGLTWTEGHPVEGYSNLLWILLIASLGVFGIDLIDASRILGVLGMCVVQLLLVTYSLRKYEFSKIWFSLFVSLLFFSLAAPIAVWSIGGLEQPLYGALIATSIFLVLTILDSTEVNKTYLVYLTIVLGLLCITRPDGPIFTVISTAIFFVKGRFYGGNKFFLSSLWVLIIPLLLYFAQIVFRFFYYGELVPNTALVKLAPSPHHFLNGWLYLKEGIMSLFPFSFIAVILLFALVVFSNTRIKGLYLFVIGCAWSAYIVFIGGDIFPAFRHFIPLIVVLAFALIEGNFLVVNCLQGLSSQKYYYLFIFTVLVLFLPFISIQFNHVQNQRAIEERWEWDGKNLGLLLKKAFSIQQPLLAVTAAGCIPYWSQLPVIDMLGLNDYYLPRNPPKDFGTGFLGHELGEGKYVLDREPDIIVFNIGTKPYFRSGVEMQHMPEFHQRYIPINTRISDKYQSLVYFYKYSKKIGIVQTQTQIKLPGFLFQGENSLAVLNDINKLVVEFNKDQPVQITFNSIFSQGWSVEIKSPNSENILSEISQQSGSIFIKLTSKNGQAVQVEEVILLANDYKTQN